MDGQADATDRRRAGAGACSTPTRQFRDIPARETDFIMAKTGKGDAKAKPIVRSFGAHMSIAGGCDRAVRAAQAVGFETVQLFTKNNNQWNAPPLD